MYNRLMEKKELDVKVGDRVNVQGWIGTVTEVYHGIDTEWNGTEYVEVPGTESTSVTVHFDDAGIGGQYQDGHYGGYWVIEEDKNV